MIAAKAFDPVVGVDVHIIQPPGPVPPVPVPHPFIGMLVDPIDFAPVIGATVMVNGMPRATAGTGGKCIPPHIPIGGVFVKPPANECEIFMGSATVLADGDPLSSLGMPCLSCHDVGMPPPPRPKKKRKPKSLTLPTSVVLAVPAGAPVLVGGPPTVSMMALGMKAAMAGLGKAFKKLKKTKAFKKAKGALEKAKKKATRNMKPGFVKCKVLKAEPVNIVTGEVVVEQIDFQLPWRIPITWTRCYSSQNPRLGVCGYGWDTPADARLELGTDGVVIFRDGTPGGAVFPLLPRGGPVAEVVGGAMLQRGAGGGLSVRRKDGITFHFPVPQPGDHEVLVDSITDRSHNRLHFVRDGGQLAEIRDDAGSRVVAHNAGGRLAHLAVVSQEHGGGLPLVSYQHDGRLLTAAVDALGAPYRFTYDDQHRLVRHTDRNGLSFHYGYETGSGNARCTRAWGDGGLYNYTFEYQRNETRITNSLGHSYAVQHLDGLVLREIDPVEGTTIYEYDAAGRTSAVVDPAGNRTEYAYDDAGNLTGEVRADGSAYTVAFDENHCPVELTDPNGNVWKQVWDERGLLRERIKPKGGRWLYDYDAAGAVAAITDPLEVTTHLEVDRWGNIVSVRNALGDTTHLAYDILGQLTSETDPAGARTTYQRDAAGRLVGVTFPSGASRRYAYDAEDNPVTIQDEAGGTTQLRYVGIGQLAQCINPDGSTVHYRYDSEEKLVGVVDANGRAYTLERDPLGRIVRESDYWGNTSEYRYNESGLVRETVGPDGVVTGLEYDPLGRMVGRTYDNGARDRFAYDANGNLTAASSPDGTVSREYDEENNLILEIQGDFRIENEFDLIGNRVGRRTSLGHDVRVDYDVAGRTRAIYLDHEPLARITRNAAGLPVREELSGGLERTFDYDGNGRLVHRRLAGMRSVIAEKRFGYDPVGNLRHRETGLGSVEFRYDPLGRIREQLDAVTGIERFARDPAGDLLREVTGKQRMSRGRRAELHGAVYEFDVSGNLTARRGPRGTATFQWNGLNRLTGALSEDGRELRFGYDALGRRIFKDVDGRRTRFYWDGDHLLSDEVAGHAAREFIYRPGTFEPLASVNGRVCHYETDSSGVPHEVVTEAGEVVWQASYGALGDARDPTIALETNPLRLQGQYYDEELQLHYNRHRYYDPAVEAFISKDPLALLAGENLYRFGPNVWTWFDPLGLACTSNASADLPQLKGKSETEVGKILEANGFKKTKVSNSPARNETWKHADGSEVRVHPYGDVKQKPWKSANNAHVHKQDPSGNQLTDRGIVSTNPNETHIGIKNPPDLPAIRGRPHGAGTA